MLPSISLPFIQRGVDRRWDPCQILCKAGSASRDAHALLGAWGEGNRPEIGSRLAAIGWARREHHGEATPRLSRWWSAQAGGPLPPTGLSVAKAAAIGVERAVYALEGDRCRSGSRGRKVMILAVAGMSVDRGGAAGIAPGLQASGAKCPQRLLKEAVTKAVGSPHSGLMPLAGSVATVSSGPSPLVRHFTSRS